MIFKSPTPPRGLLGVNREIDFHIPDCEEFRRGYELYNILSMKHIGKSDVALFDSKEEVGDLVK